MSYPDFSPDVFKIGHFILFKNNGSFLGNIIEKEQLKMGYPENQSCYTHVEVSEGGYDTLGASVGGIKTRNLVKDYSGREIAVVAPFISDYETRGRYKVAIHMAKLYNRKYDYFALLGFMLREKFSYNGCLLAHNDKFVCSTSAMSALLREYPKYLSINPRLCVPADFAGEYFRVVWNGVIPVQKP